MERKRKEVDGGKSKSQLASSSGSIHSQAPKALVKMEQDGSPASKARAALYYDNSDEIMKKARFGEAPKAFVEMGKDGSSMSKARARAESYSVITEKVLRSSKKTEKDGSSSKERAGSHSFMGNVEKARLGVATRASVKMGKDLSSTSKVRASSHSFMEIKEKARLGEAMRASMKMGKDQSLTSKARASSSNSSKVMEKEMKKPMKMEKCRLSMSKARAPSHSLMEIKEKAKLGEATRATRASGKMEKDRSSASKARAASQFVFETMGKSKPGEPSKTLCPSCMESNVEMYRNSLCSHSFCIKCISIYVSLSIDAAQSMIRCPAYKCKALLEPSPRIAYRPVLERWIAAKHEALDIDTKKKGVSRKTEYPWHSYPEWKDQLWGLGESAKQVGEPSQGRFRLYEICEICCEKKDRTEMFRNEGCRHLVCTDCIGKHIEVKIESNSGMILCPGLDCRGVLAPELCKEFLPQSVVERWERTIIETLILDSEKFYCPYKDCSAMLLSDNAEEMKMMRESECPHCRRLFCVQCRVPWHSGMECREFQKLNADERGREDILLKKLAEEKKWKRCPKCKFYVEKTEGCVHMICRCRFEFCYRCGRKWAMNHSTCQILQ